MLTAFAALTLASSAAACTLVGVGSKATMDGSALVGTTMDSMATPVDLRLVRVPAMNHSAGAQRAVYNDALHHGYPRFVSTERGPGYLPLNGSNQTITTPLGYIPQVNSTYAYWDGDYGMQNEVQLSIAESTCAARTVGYPLDMPNGRNLLSINELSRIALERCDTSRLGDDQFTIVPNTFVIRTLNLTDSANYLASSNVSAHAYTQGWASPEEPFDFTLAYGYDVYTPNKPLYSGRRMWRGYDMVAPSLHLDPDVGFHVRVPTYPLSVKPDTLMTPTSIMQYFSDYYENTTYDLAKGVAAGPFHDPARFGHAHRLDGNWERSISIARTTHSIVLQTRPNMADAIGGVAWTAAVDPDTGVLSIVVGGSSAPVEAFSLSSGFLLGFLCGTMSLSLVVAVVALVSRVRQEVASPKAPASVEEQGESKSTNDEAVVVVEPVAVV
ncbi:hypothetical protein H257_16521 [Aphanomyces astaci]|uniref:Peptidase A1 domain-containing protein n=1 Tax=Aphanomyces astaci TaxID=112090 RepID=W4FIE1_APHAT|nr:hypothetical protein H257_16521 [Aphanomyces astaci]ETV67287.1 hypothetical protein H257_16521 [Aphanomyces astaci]|eukprot:XP_009843275.1 hypothetical protein H257_16521 [Aphanomyces astaci]